MAAMSLLTVDDFLALPDERPYREFVKGDIWQNLQRDLAIAQPWLS